MNFYDERDYSNSAISLSNFLSIAIIIMLPLSLILSTRILSKAFKGDHLKNQDDF